MSLAKRTGSERSRKKRRKPAPAAARVAPTSSPVQWWIAVLVAVVLGGVTVWAWPPRPSPEPHVKHGNELYSTRQYRDALGEYESAPGSGPRNAGVQLDRGLARYRVTVPPPDGGGLPMLTADASAPEGLDHAQDEMRTAVRGGTTNAGEDVDVAVRAHAAYDLANTFFSQHHWDNAIDSYKEALRLRPSWRDAAWNLELARRLREQERNPPDAGQDASPDVAPDVQDSGSDANDAATDSGHDGGGEDSGSGDAASDGARGDSGTQSDSGSPGNDAGANQPDSGSESEPDGGVSRDAAPPRSMAPLDDLDRGSRSLQNEILRRRGVSPRSPDDDR